jgi:diamine N-acetyltransferase
MKQVKLFTKFGFECIGIKKDWNLVKGVYKDEAIFQLINQILKF